MVDTSRMTELLMMRRYTARGLDNYLRDIDLSARKACEIQGYDWSLVKRQAELIYLAGAEDVVILTWSVSYE